MRNKLLNWIGFLYVVIVLAGWCGPSAAMAQNSEEVYSYGSGPVEVLIFTDYYCPPCQAVEPYLEGALSQLWQSGVKITFVDKPIHRVTPIYSKYFLYAAKKARNFDEVLRIRRVLFDIAKANVVASERELVQNIRDNRIEMLLFEVKPVFDRWVELIGRYEVKSTPTCVIVQPGQEPRMLKGSEEIPAGVGQLITELSERVKK